MSGAYTDTFQDITRALRKEFENYIDANILLVTIPPQDNLTAPETKEEIAPAIEKMATLDLNAASQQLATELNDTQTTQGALTKSASASTITSGDRDVTPSPSQLGVAPVTESVHLDLSDPKNPTISKRSKKAQKVVAPQTVTEPIVAPVTEAVAEPVAELVKSIAPVEAQHGSHTEPSVINTPLHTPPSYSVSSYLLNGYKLALHQPDITAAKIETFKDLLVKMKKCMEQKHTFSKLPPSTLASAVEEGIRFSELETLTSTIGVLLAHAETAKIHLKQARKGKLESTAEATLNILPEILNWLQMPNVSMLLHTVLGYENDFRKNTESPKEGDVVTVEAIEVSYVSDLFRWWFFIKLDEIKNRATPKSREVSKEIASDLMENFEETIGCIYLTLYLFHCKQQKSIDERDSLSELEWRKQIILTLKNSIGNMQNLFDKHAITEAPEFLYSVVSFSPIAAFAAAKAVSTGETFLQKIARSILEYKNSIQKHYDKLKVEKTDLDVKYKTQKSRMSKSCA